jgi:hypothetical protein
VFGRGGLNMYKQDIDKLKVFINSVKEDIDLIVSHLYEITTEERIQNLSIEKAWEDIKPRFEEIVQTLKGEGLLSSKKIEEELANKSLLGSQLDIKLELYQSHNLRQSRRLDKTVNRSKRLKTMSHLWWQLFKYL